MKDYRAIFDAAESTLFSIGSRNRPVEEIRATLERFKEVETKTVSDDEYYEILVNVVFFYGFRASIVTNRLSVIHSHFHDYRFVAKYDEQKALTILNDVRMIRNRNKIHACIENAKTVLAIVNEYGSFQKYIDSFEAKQSDSNLMRLKEELQRRFKGLGGITTYHFLTDIGMNVLKPDRVIKRIFARLGLVGSSAGEIAFVQEGRKFAAATRHPIRYIDIVFVFYGQAQSRQVGLEHGICLEQKPFCSLCGMRKFCNYYAEHRASRAAA